MSNSNPSDNTLSFPSQWDIGALAFAVLPFVCNFTTSSSRTVNGRVVEESSFDWFDPLGGGIAILLGVYIAATVLSQTAENDRLKRIALIIGVILLGAFHVARGLDLL
jgi:UDP-N-acetylmuramyl pentapeptide phosphotransferase/UDP-N-acetylglucosamine-1-phosphate transferase